MATPTLTPVATTRTAGINLGTAPVPATLAGDSWVNTGKELYFVKNGSGAPITITQVLAVGAVVDGIPVTSRTMVIAAGASFILGPFPTGAYNDTNGFCNITYTSVTTITVLVFYQGP
jgi:hypothetical protein